MKRYDIGEYDSGMVPHIDGDWVKYEDVKQTEELNREMVEALKEVTSNYYDDYTLPQSVVTHVRQVLQKVKAEVQGE